MNLFSKEEQEKAIASTMMEKIKQTFPDERNAKVSFSLDTSKFTIIGLSEDKINELLIGLK